MSNLSEALHPAIAAAEALGADAPPEAQADAQQALLSTQAARPGVTILMVDDEPMMTEVTQAYLEEAGYTHFVAVHDPRQALAQARESRPGLVLLDLMMPGLDGFALLQAIRADEALRYTPVIVLTAHTDPASKLRALGLGATEFLAKPVDASELKIRVRNSLAFKVYQDRLANEDPLTGLPNRRVFVEGLREALVVAQSGGSQLALLQVNLDRFRQVNASLGHAAGDALLADAAARLRLAARAGSSPGVAGQRRRDDPPLLARIGGDEFGLLLPGIGNAEPAQRVARQLLHALAMPFSVDGRELFVSPSIGVALYPADGEDDATLLRNAGSAMRQAKADGGNSVQFYRAELNQDAMARLEMENQLRRALEQGELQLHYQPKIALASGRLIGTEALLRWHNPVLGSVPPGRFIPVAEETGLIVPIGEWVIEEACAQMAAWHREAGVRIPVAVNVARHGLASGRLQQVVQQALERHQVPPQHLTLELTESMLMDRVETMAERLRALRALGVNLSIDDFGTGYSSMSYLKQFPLQELKIDRSFVMGTPDDATDLAIVRTLIALGHNLGMKVVAEGVETPEQRAALAELGCDTFQGFLVSRPIPPDALLAKVRQARRPA